MRYLRYLLFAGLVVGLPLLGLRLDGMHLQPYLEFPPRSTYVVHLPFLWPVFVAMAAGIVGFGYLVGVSLLVAWAAHRRAPVPGQRQPFPGWGWAALIALAVCWGIAWTRLPWLAWLQPHTYTPLWLAYILLVNAVVYHRTGRCLVTHRPRLLLWLFAASAVFWWGFEYLNRFVQNWYYREFLDYSPFGYFLAASLAFATVLPAVFSTQELLLSVGWFNEGYRQGWRLRLPWPKVWAVLSVLAGCLTLLGIGVLPNVLYPMLWVAPLLVLAGLETLAGKPHLFTDLRQGDWRPVVSTMLAALVCGFFWEMWNSRSQAKWFYDIPLVHRFQLFEMPILGYAGYLPFGWECALAGGLVERQLSTT